MRFYDLKHIKKAIKKATKYAQKIVFIGAMISSHPDFDEICLYLKKIQEKKQIQVEFSSMGFEHYCANVPALLSEKTVSLAIESGSEELRFKTGKNLSDEKIIETIKFYTELGITKFNLYFLLGLPEETQSDVEKYIQFSLKLTKLFPETKFYHIISTFIPKPNAELNMYLEKIKETLSQTNIELCLPFLHNDGFNALISLGDRRLSHYIKHIFEKNTPVKDLLIEYRKFMKKHNEKITDDFKLPHYVEYIYKEKPDEQLLPWEFISF